MKETGAVVFVVDDDPLVRKALQRLIQSEGLQVQTFGSAQEFLHAERPDAPACLVLDIRLPDIGGLDLQQKLTEASIMLPIIFITGHGNVPMSVRAMKAGAVEFLTKPFGAGVLLEGIHRALKQNEAARQRQAEISELQRRYRSLTPREREVFAWVAGGLLNKQVAAKLGTSEKTIKIHRHQVMQKMKAEAVVDLARMADKLGIPFPPGSH